MIKNFNEYQLELYSNLYDSALETNTARKLLYKKQLEKTLNDSQQFYLNYILMGLDFLNQWNKEYELKKKEYDNQKATLFSGLKYAFHDDLELYDLLKIRLEQELTCE